MAIMANCCFFVHLNLKEFKQNFHFIKFLSLSFDLIPLKVNLWHSTRVNFAKDYQKDSYDRTHLM
jgi:hypothetical protein